MKFVHQRRRAVPLWIETRRRYAIRQIYFCINPNILVTSHSPIFLEWYKFQFVVRQCSGSLFRQNSRLLRA